MKTNYQRDEHLIISRSEGNNTQIDYLLVGIRYCMNCFVAWYNSIRSIYAKYNSKMSKRGSVNDFLEESEGREGAIFLRNNYSKRCFT